MVSATAILISGVNSRYIAISDRVRSLTREYREESASNDRRANIRRQMRVFHLRLHLVSWATRVLYMAVGCFITVALLISLSIWRQRIQGVTLPLFVVGLVLIGLAIVLQLLELQYSNSTIHIEASDLLRDSSK
jgi:hypothetical protein